MSEPHTYLVSLLLCSCDIQTDDHDTFIKRGGDGTWLDIAQHPDPPLKLLLQETSFRPLTLQLMQ